MRPRPSRGQTAPGRVGQMRMSSSNSRLARPWPLSSALLSSCASNARLPATRHLQSRPLSLRYRLRSLGARNGPAKSPDTGGSQQSADQGIGPGWAGLLKDIAGDARSLSEARHTGHHAWPRPTEGNTLIAKLLKLGDYYFGAILT
ncbi:hypothetical protein NDU88_005097 [Pleurodeles waltl]|uniref:Uncharacterized protein n=1 Tax=Pleurodeles waltl TaxID=8319 RepID=A0AAV7MVE9_PLEWA|nr:hypothetical protein NDU88_005097 [Pleurodeles waltl]